MAKYFPLFLASWGDLLACPLVTNDRNDGNPAVLHFSTVRDVFFLSLPRVRNPTFGNDWNKQIENMALAGCFSWNFWNLGMLSLLKAGITLLSFLVVKIHVQIMQES